MKHQMTMAPPQAIASTSVFVCVSVCVIVCVIVFVGTDVGGG